MIKKQTLDYITLNKLWHKTLKALDKANAQTLFLGNLRSSLCLKQILLNIDETGSSDLVIRVPADWALDIDRGFRKTGKTEQIYVLVALPADEENAKIARGEVCPPKPNNPLLDKAIQKIKKELNQAVEEDPDRASLKKKSSSGRTATSKSSRAKKSTKRGKKSGSS